jgi:acyl carrier protein
MEILSELKELAAKQFGGDAASIDVDAPVEKLGLDSLGFMEFLFEAEDRLGITIPQDQVATVKTLRELAGLIERVSTQPKAANS